MSEFRTFPPCPLLSPVPAVLISCRAKDPEAKPNLLTVAWAGTVNSNPPMLSISVRKERYSYAMLRDSGEFVVNLVDAEHCKALDYCGVKSGRDVDKWAETGLTPVAADGLTFAPAVAECPAYLSCKVEQIIPLGSHDMFLARIVSVAAQERFFAPDGSLHLEAAHLVAYAHGVYQRSDDVLGFFGYSLARPEVQKKRMKGYWK